MDGQLVAALGAEAVVGLLRSPFGSTVTLKVVLCGCLDIYEQNANEATVK